VLGNNDAISTDLSFERNTALEAGGGLYADEITVTDSVFRDNQAGAGGGAYGAYIERADFFDNTATSTGGAYAGASLTDVLIDGSSAPNGGAIDAPFGTFSGTGLIVRDSVATTGNGGAIRSENLNGAVVLQDARLTGNSACGHGGAIYVDLLASVDFQDAQIWDNQANTCGGGGNGGGLWLRSQSARNDDVSLSGLHICGNSADNAGGLYLKNGQGLTLSHLALVDNTATSTGGGALLRVVEDSAIEHSVFLGNSAATGGGLYASLSGLDIVNSVFAYTTAGRGLTLTSATWDDSSVSYTDFYSNLSSHVGGNSAFSTSENNNLAVDPGFQSYTADGDCSNDTLWLSSSSSLVDAGEGFDADGSTADIGVHGGLSAWDTDRDGDGSDYDADCDDLNPDAYPGGTETCGGLDEDCDGSVDESGASDALTWYLDDDEDGYGDAASTEIGCTAPSGYVADNTDCDDTDSAINPGAREVCGAGLDNDCDGVVDPTDSWDVQVFRLDADGDGFGQSNLAIACTLGEGLSENNEDCDDTDATVFPGAVEIPYDGIDQDCSGGDLCDVDEDGFDDARCGGDDCDDNAALHYPGAPETPYDGIDQDCDGSDWCDIDQDGLDALTCGGTDCDDTDSAVGVCEDTGDTGSVDDTGTPADTDTDPETELSSILSGGSGCRGCSGQGGSPIGWLSLGFAALLLGRRRRSESHE
jgi:predicted outer membrane repeat protein